MIKFRIDVDYPYPSRAKSFLYLALGIKRRKGKDYLENARIIAQMLNESPKQVMAYWFFTPYTIPDQKLLDLLTPQRHEVALHVATKPFEEWKILENETRRTVQYYTIHGTNNLLARILWGRKLRQNQASIPSDFPVKSFHDFPTFSLDLIRYEQTFERAKELADEWIGEGKVASIHPEWLFKIGKKNHRGPYYDLLKLILEVDGELETLKLKKKNFAVIANDCQEYEKDINPTDRFLEKLEAHGIDIFTFLERTWCSPPIKQPTYWTKEDDNIGLLEIKDYESWWNAIGKKTRNMVRRAEKSGVNVALVEPSDKLAEGIWKIYNETPIRQGRAFPHYGESLASVVSMVSAASKSTFIGAYLGEELIGFIQIVYGDSIAIISNILSLQQHWDKSVNNALLAKAVEVCASKNVRWLMYGRIGNHPSLDKFKESNGFTKFPVTRYYVPITQKGKIAIKLGLHRNSKMPYQTP